MKLEERIKLTYSGIYLIRNTITGHCYIGQARNISNRIYSHLRSTYLETETDYNYPLHKAIRKYGVDNFELEVLERCSYDNLNRREQYWISIYDSRKTGYNQTNGGEQSGHSKKLSLEQAEQLKQLLRDNILSNTELAKQFNISSCMVQRINMGKLWYDNSITYPIRTAPKERKNHYNGSCIKQIDKNTDKVIRVFPSISAAAKALGLKSGATGAISDCLYRQNGSAYGYKWEKEYISKEDWLKILD